MNGHVNWNTVGIWFGVGLSLLAGLPNFVQGARWGAFHRIWNWPLKIGLGSWLLAFLLPQVLHGPAAFPIFMCLFGGGMVSLMVFVAVMLAMMIGDSRKPPEPQGPPDYGGSQPDLWPPPPSTPRG